MTTISALPTPPSRDDPTNFATRGDALLGALPTFVTETNLVAGEVNAAAAVATTKAAEAVLSASNASASEAAAIAASGANLWVSGTYALGDVRWSPSTFLSYRCKTAGSRTIDPAQDGANWRCLNGDSAWQIKTTTYTAQAGDRIMADTSTGAFTITLPATPAANDRVVIADYAGTFGTNNLTVARNGANVMGFAEDMVISTNNVRVTLEYIDSVQGWKL